MATGVLILGIGAGTKQLGHFTTECTKSYETVCLFGAATDTYDVEGKVVAKKPTEHITRAMVEEKLGKFRGKIMQKPPIYSALKVNGKKMYEYAREGKELPIEIKERPVKVLEMEITEWMDSGEHEFRWPEKEAEGVEKEIAEKMLKIAGGGENATHGTSAAEESAVAGQKRTREEQDDAGPSTADSEPAAKRTKAEDDASAAEPSAQPPTDSTPTTTTPRPRCPAPACRIRMTVTSGFYVRSLCHDLGAAVDSLATMAALVRTRQGDFALGENVLEYEDLKKGEDVWGPKVRELLNGSAGKMEAPKEVVEDEAKAESKEEAIEEMNAGEGGSAALVDAVKADASAEQSEAGATAEAVVKPEAETSETAERSTKEDSKPVA
jgi:tRNA pseudouridine55 synthase